MFRKMAFHYLLTAGALRIRPRLVPSVLLKRYHSSSISDGGVLTEENVRGTLDLLTIEVTLLESKIGIYLGTLRGWQRELARLHGDDPAVAGFQNVLRELQGKIDVLENQVKGKRALFAEALAYRRKQQL